jgi:hypothetical protein
MHRLATSRAEINDSKTAVTKPDTIICRTPTPLGVRPAM